MHAAFKENVSSQNQVFTPHPKSVTQQNPQSVRRPLGVNSTVRKTAPLSRPAMPTPAPLSFEVFDDFSVSDNTGNVARRLDELQEDSSKEAFPNIRRMLVAQSSGSAGAPDWARYGLDPENLEPVEYVPKPMHSRDSLMDHVLMYANSSSVAKQGDGARLSYLPAMSDDASSIPAPLDLDDIY
eukprot:ANDGO_02492.mRNA.1 hypothetical protein